MNEFSEIYLNTFYIGVTTEIKLLRSSKTLNQLRIVNVSRLFYIFMSPFGYTMYHGKTMNTLLPVTAGEMENYENSTINKLCHKNERVLF